MSHRLKPILFSTVFLTGAAVLIFEIAAVRALSPYFGASIYVVSSVLTVILAALSLGYWFGGRIADRFPDARLLYIIIAFSGMTMNILYLLSLAAFPLAGEILPITFGPLILSTVFFMLPAFLLGIDSPFVIKLLTDTNDPNHNGAVVGSTFFWSTLGSITGSLASGFLLIPLAGLKLTFVGTASILSLLACFAYLVFARRIKNEQFISLAWIYSVTIISIFAAAVVIRTGYIGPQSENLLYHTDGFYSQIEVRERKTDTATIRILRREVNSSSAIKTGTSSLVFEYSEYARLYKVLQDSTDSYLVIGGGAYTIPRTLLLEDPDLSIDVVEIEPKLYGIAKAYFELPSSERLTDYSMDARTFLHTTDKKYDIIFLDAFQSGHFIPPHLTTREFFLSVRDHLTEEGILIANIIGQSGQNEKSLAGSLIKTMQSVFPSLITFTASNDNQRLKNFIVVGNKSGAHIQLSEDFVIDRKNGSSTPAISRQLSLDDFYLDKQIIFTDDKAPVALLLAKQILQR